MDAVFEWLVVMLIGFMVCAALCAMDVAWRSIRQWWRHSR